MKRVKTICGIIVAPLLSWIFPVFFLYAQNVKEMQIIEIIQPTSIFIVCMIASLLLGRILFREWNIASVFSFICGLFLGNFSLILKAIQRVFPIVRYWHLIFAMLIVSIVLCKVLNHKKDLAKEVTFIGTIALGGLMAFNLIMAVPTIVTKLNVALTSEKNVSLNSQESIGGKRNIYYLLCDEYASFAQLEEDFGYDNSDFKVKLQNLGFNISESSYNDSYQTVVVMANIMQLDYLATDDSTSVELENLTKNGIVQDIFRKNGYTLRGIGNTEWLGIDGTVESAGGAITADGADAMRLALDKSFLGALVKRNYSAEAANIINAFEELNQIEIEPNSSTYTMFYVSAPHHPYYLDSNGNMNPPEKWRNDDSGKNNDAYIGELEYVNKKIYSAVERIIQNDPEAIILLCSDHGNRFGTVSEGMKRRILNTIYYHGDVIEEFEGMSGVNTLRYIFNTEFSTNLPYIELP